MAHVSRKKIDRKQWQMMWVKMVGLVAEDMDLGEAEVLLDGLLTETEKVMLVKRLMAGVMFNSGWSVPKISQVLGLSTATVYKFKIMYKQDKKFREFLEKKFPQKIEKPRRGIDLVGLVGLVGEYFEYFYKIKSGKKTLGSM